MATVKKVERKLRLTTQVSIVEKQRAEKLAKADGFSSVGELVRKLLSDRHKMRAQAKKDAKLLGNSLTSLPAKTRNGLALSDATLSTKPTRTVGTRKRTGSRTASSTTKKTRNRRVIAVATNKVGNTAGRATKRRTVTNRSTKLG